jgi:RNA polymerase-binding transcription factor DksA
MARSHIERLEEFREILVATRREGIRNVLQTRDAMQASGFQIQGSDGSSYGAELKALQEEIEAVDRALEEEKRLALGVEGEGAVQPRRRPKLVKGT